MAAYAVEIESSAAKSLMSINRADQTRIARRIKALGEEPRPAGAQKLGGGSGWRIRVGDYRVVYLIEDTIRVVTVTRVAHRRSVHRRP